jgi:hypothetical protein
VHPPLLGCLAIQTDRNQHRDQKTLMASGVVIREFLRIAEHLIDIGGLGFHPVLEFDDEDRAVLEDDQIRTATATTRNLELEDEREPSRIGEACAVEVSRALHKGCTAASGIRRPPDALREQRVGSTPNIHATLTISSPSTMSKWRRLFEQSVRPGRRHVAAISKSKSPTVSRCWRNLPRSSPKRSQIPSSVDDPVGVNDVRQAHNVTSGRVATRRSA